jgi:putative endonuclease
MPWVYMLECSDGSYYVGSTTDLAARLAQHGAGLGAAYTRRRLPVSLVWSHESPSIAEVFFLEKRIQGWSRRKREALIRGDFDALSMLASRSRAAREARDAMNDGG